MSSTFSNRIKLSIFGQSHGKAIGMTLDGIPAGLAVDEEELQSFLRRRAPGQHDYETSRKEDDKVEFLSGIVNGFTCGAPISAIIENNNTHSSDYADQKDCPRPGHADFAAQMKYGGYQDVAGGGHFSGRLTAAMCIAGGLCLQWLALKGIRIAAHLHSIAGIEDTPFDPVDPQIDKVSLLFPVLDSLCGEKMREAIAAAKADGDSVGGVIECAVTGLPAGIGEPMFGGLENRIAQIVFGIPAVKGVEFGAGFASARMHASHHNDPYRIEGGKVKTLTNHAGGILGGISTGMPIIFRAAIKPTPSIASAQQSVSLKKMQEQTLYIKGRHDPCIAPRAVAVIEAAAAIAVFDAILDAYNTMEV